MYTDAYGSMLWDLGSPTSEQFFKCWNTCVKLCNDVPRSTFTYLVEGWFVAGMIPLRNQVISRYPGFYRKLLSSPSREIRALARIVSNDPRSTTCKNLRFLRSKTEMNQPEFYSSLRIKAALPVQAVPECEKWRLGLLANLLMVRGEKHLRVEDTRSICAMIDSLWIAPPSFISSLGDPFTHTIWGPILVQLGCEENIFSLFLYLELSLVRINPTNMLVYQV